MIFESKISRVVNVEEAERSLSDGQALELEKNDGKAIAIAATLVFVPAILGTLLFFYSTIWFLFLR